MENVVLSIHHQESTDSSILLNVVSLFLIYILCMIIHLHILNIQWWYNRSAQRYSQSSSMSALHYKLYMSHVVYMEIFNYGPQTLKQYYEICS